MADMAVIKEYLVSLGFRTDQRQLSHFTETLKKVANESELVAGKMAKGFLIAGITVTGALAGIAAGFISLADHVSQNDLDMQVFARRMFLSTDAARKMKMATDALGYSLEEIIWGPPELAERYRKLNQDQDKMLRALGGTDFENQMRALRDIRFEFTRLGVVMQYFAMDVVKELSKALWGDENALQQKLQHFVDWFMEKMPDMAKSFASDIAPALHKLGAAFSMLADSLAKVDWATVTSNIVTLVAKLVEVSAWTVGHLFPKTDKVEQDKINRWGARIGLPHLGNWYENTSSDDSENASPAGRVMSGDARSAAAYIGQALGVDPSWIYGQFVHETGGFKNRGATQLNNLAGIRIPGSSEYRNFSDLQEFSDYYIQMLHNNRYAGAIGAKTDADFFKGLKQGGYYEDSYENYLKGSRTGEATYNPTAYHSSVGDIHININQPNATPQQIHAAVSSAIDEKLGRQNQRALIQLQGAYA